MKTRSTLEKQDRWGLLLRVIREARPIYPKLALAALYSILGIACAILIPILLGQSVQLLYDYWAGETAGTPLVSALVPGLLVLGGVYLVQAVLSWAKMYTLNCSVSRFYTCNMRIRLADKISRLPVSYVDKTPAGQILDRMTEDVSNIGNSLHNILDTLFSGFLQIAAVSVTMLLEDWRLALVVIALTPVSIWLSSYISSKSERHFDKMFEQGGRLYSLVEESYSNYQTTKAYNYEAVTEEKHRELNRGRAEAEFMGSFLSAIVRPCIAFTNALAYIVLCLLGGWLIVYRGVSVGVIVTLILFARQYSAPLETIAEGISSLQRTRASAKRVFGLLDEEEEAPLAGHIEGEISGKVRFENVNFSYDKAVPLIRDLSIDVKEGQKVAIVGPTGAGKTTIVNLLMRFYDIDSGRITIDGQDVSQICRDDIRALFAMVLQDTWLFSGTVAENVAYGRPEATREEIIAACDDAYCDHFIRTLPQGYDTPIGEDTISISGGQKQLLTIARAVLANRRLLILDEATSNVDTRTEILIQKAMDKLMRGKTCFIIAHRLSTIVDADLILVLRDGQIVETGKHRELLDKKGFYYELYSSQYAI